MTVDAQNRTMGRVASEAASFLLGKRSVGFAKNAKSSEPVEIVNASKVRISAKKEKAPVTRYSGHPGGLTSETMGAQIARKGWDAAFRRMVLGMLPRNRLRAQIIKRLKVTD
ncbi:MAG TPA: uL13 family ribosomal protein [Candidatus Paceibacterota bacterium]